MDRKTPIITLLTDFGLKDEFVGVMKGAIASIATRAHVIDITHNITSHNIMQAALTLYSAFKYFPKGSTHVIVVDPGVGGKRKIICLKAAGHYFIAPDNGVLGLVIKHEKVEEIYAVTNEEYFLAPVSETFHGRDIFAPVSAHLSKGIDVSCLGERLRLEDLATLDLPVATFSSDGKLTGQIISIDHFGNLITNIDRNMFGQLAPKEGAKDLVIHIAKRKIHGVSQSYDTVSIGAPVAIFGSKNLLEISLNQSDAGAYFKARVGETVTVEMN
ncbi:MAG: SAM-dependent chlorinase/fluorinase [Deltaproteobacteria bacterium]|nr:SAM-dependent chlorinase/fluorinase [Deltaproteobacteria bacterium]